MTHFSVRTGRYRRLGSRPLSVLSFLHRHHRLRIAGCQGIHVGEDQVAGAVAAEGVFVFAADYGEGSQHVAGVVAAQAVEVEVERVEPGAQVAALLFVPDERRAVIAEVAGERRHVVGGVGEAEHVIADQLPRRHRAEPAVVGVGRDDGQLFDDE